ncbi:MAG: leucine-rich repeat domain-containing protein [Eubacterium sp.]|nr:leucine-rich repeat domain-containing protein [Eubacterium sp.]
MKKTKIVALALAATLALSAPMTFAAESPTSSTEAEDQTNVEASNGNKVDTSSDGTAAINKVSSSKKAVAVAATVKVDGVSYKVTVINGGAFKKCKKATKITLPATVKNVKKKAFTGAKKLKKVILKGKKVVKFKKGAFKGLNTKKITVKASKLSKKNLKKLKKALKKAGFKGKVTK